MGKTYETVGELLADVVSGEQLRDWIRALWEERHEAKAEIERLRAIVDKLPRTADGTVPCVGMMVYYEDHNDATRIHERTIARIVQDRDGCWLDWEEEETATGREPADCFGTRGAAFEAAKEE